MKKIIIRLLLLSFLLSLQTVQDSNSYFSSQVKDQKNVFSTTCWLPPSIPVLVYPPDNHFAGLGSDWDLDPYLDWQDSISDCPLNPTLTYQYESYSDPDLNVRLYQSGWLSDSQIPVPGTPDGVYYWRVRSRDSFGHESNFSPAWKLTVDRSLPTSEITSVQDYSTFQTFDINYDSSADTDFVQLCYSYNLGDWICDLAYIDHPASPGTFTFDSPQGDGIYDFYTLATDHAGNTEDDTDKTSSPYEIQVDTQGPFTNLSLGEFGDDDVLGNRFALNEQMVNGNFEDTNDPESGWVWDGDGEHRVVTDTDLAGISQVKDGNNSALIGWLNSDPIADGSDYLYQTISVPGTTSTLSFWYQVLSNDIVDYDYFEAKIVGVGGAQPDETIIQTGLDESGIDTWYRDSLWQEITYSLDNWLDSTVQLWFSIINRDEVDWPLKKTAALIDDVRITNSDNFVTTDKEMELANNDTGSGIKTTWYRINGGDWIEYVGAFDPYELGIADGTTGLIEYYSVDLAGNIEATRSLELTVDNSKDYFGIVLNGIMPNPNNEDPSLHAKCENKEWIELFNLSDVTVDVNGWEINDVYKYSGGARLEVAEDENRVVLNSGNSASNSTVVNPNSSLIFCDSFDLNNTGGIAEDDRIDGVRLFAMPGDNLIDSFSYQWVLKDKPWRRIPDGTGTWADPEEEKEIEVEIKPAGESKIILSIVNISENYSENGNLFEYELTYIDEDNIEKGIAGQILPETVKSNEANCELYLGTCSAKGICIPDVIKDGSIYLTIIQGEITVVDNRQFKI